MLTAKASTSFARLVLKAKYGTRNVNLFLLLGSISFLCHVVRETSGSLGDLQVHTQLLVQTTRFLS